MQFLFEKPDKNFKLNYVLQTDEYELYTIPSLHRPYLNIPKVQDNIKENFVFQERIKFKDFGYKNSMRFETESGKLYRIYKTYFIKLLQMKKYNQLDHIDNQLWFDGRWTFKKLYNDLFIVPVDQD